MKNDPITNAPEKKREATDSIRTRYFKFEMTSNYAIALAYVEISGFKARDASGTFIDTTGWSIHEVSSEHAPDLASNLLDDNINTAWRAVCNTITKSHVIIDMGSEREISSICYIPKPPASKNIRGRLKGYNLYFYDSAGHWYLAHTGNLNPGYTTQDIVITPSVHRNHLCVISRMGAHEEKTLKNKSQYWADFEPMGRYCQKAEAFSINIQSEIPAESTVELLIGTYYHHARDLSPEIHALTQGNNQINPGRDGLLYIRATHKDQRFSLTLSLTGATHRVAYYKLGETTNEEWKHLLAVSAFIPSAQLNSGKVVITVTLDKAREFSNEDIDRLLAEYNRIIDKADEVAGYSLQEVTIHQPTMGLHQLVECGWTDMHMFAGAFATAYNVNTIDRIMTVQGLTTADGWGPWHEIGHTYQDHLMNWHESMESTNNITSLAIEEMYDARPKWLTVDMMQEVYRFLQSPGRKIENSGNVVHLVMFTELSRLFGSTFYPRLYQNYRSNSKDPDFIRDTTAIEGDLKCRREMFAIMATRQARRNLVSFFNDWGFDLWASTVEKINALGFPSADPAPRFSHGAHSCTYAAPQRPEPPAH
jgi:hypothetical protein